jgi:hypothetical protein
MKSFCATAGTCQDGGIVRWKDLIPFADRFIKSSFLEIQKKQAKEAARIVDRKVENNIMIQNKKRQMRRKKNDRTEN